MKNYLFVMIPATLVVMLTTGYSLRLGVVTGGNALNKAIANAPAPASESDPDMASATTLSPAERKFASDYYLQTKQRFLKDVQGLSNAQLNFKADSSRWSIAECAEHIALAESGIWQMVSGGLKTPSSQGKAGETRIGTSELIQATTDRSKKFNAPEFLRPSGKFADTPQALAFFTARRDSTIHYILTTEDDLKGHFITHPVFGPLDLYQGLVFLAAHSARHTLQIEEVMANPAFPKQ